ncbi:MAG: insulinase family protein [Nannocystaceae bacterium]|nr:insulinase family protein [Nannocystaceae bacterium]
METAVDPAQQRAAILAASDLPAPQAKPLADDPMAVTIDRLSNGMSVYISVDRHEPKFVAWVAVRAGSRHDPPDSTGLAHYLEHMLFKGSDELGTTDYTAEAPHVERVRELYAELRRTKDDDARRRVLASIDAETQAQAKYAIPNELDRLYATMGFDGVNAFTSDDETVYIAEVPSNRMQHWATVEAERFSDPVFRLFMPELEAVYEEKNLSLDEPDERVWDAMRLALMPKHPYGTQTTIGTVEHLKSPAYGDMVEFFERWYVPNNMAIVLAGDVDREQALTQLEQAFGRLQPAALQTPHAGTLPAPSGRVFREVEAPGEEEVAIAWLGVPAGHADAPALAVLDRVLDDASVGLLNTELELTQKLPMALSFHQEAREAGWLGVQGVARQGQPLGEVEALLLGVIEKLRRGEFSDADVAAAKLHHEVERKRLLESTHGRAAAMMQAYVLHQGWTDVLAYERAFAAVTRDDVLRVAKRYLGPDFVVVARKEGELALPKIEKPVITPVAIDPSRSSGFARKVGALATPQLDPLWAVEGDHYVHRALPAGPMIAVKNPRNDLFSLSYAFERGYRKEPLLCHALALLELSGAGAESAEALQKRIYALGVRIETACSAEYSRIEISGPDASLEPALALLDGWLAAPRFDADTVAQLLDITLSERSDGMADDDEVIAALEAYAKFDRRSPYLQQPSNRALAKAKPRALRGLIRGLLDHEHRTLYFGPRDADAAAGVVARGRDHRKLGDAQIRVWRRVQGPQVFFLHKPGAKATVRVLMPQGPLPREQRPAAELLSEYLSGNMSALVFQEIRESRGLAYGAGAVYDVGERARDAAGLRGWLSTQADKVPEALRTFLALLRTTEIQPERVREAQRALDQRYRAARLEPRWLGWTVEGWDELGEPTDPRPWLWQRIAATTPQELSTLAAGFADAPVIIAVVGDRDRVGLSQLRQIAPTTEVDLAALYSYGAFPDGPRAADEPGDAGPPTTQD